MSLVLYGDSTDLNDDSNQYNVILDNRFSNTLVLHNKTTNKLVLMNNQVFEFERKCPHCGSIFNSTSSSSSSKVGSSKTNSDSEIGIHANYFKLLGNSIVDQSDNYESFEEYSTKTSNLPNSIFQQGYYSNFFKEKELLGKGSRGSVYKVEHFLNDVSLGVFALKKITIGDDSKWLMQVLNEVNMLVMLSCNNKNLVNYNHVWLEIASINEFGPKVPCAFILQQYCAGGSLESFVQNIYNPKLTVKEMKKYHIKKIRGRYLKNEEILLIFKDIVNGVYELHKNHIIHRDLKPSNCLLSSNYISKFELESSILDLNQLPTVLIGDFGESQLEGEQRKASGYTGTIEYTAPELFIKNNQFNKKTDVYSLGMILYFLCFSGTPFHNENNFIKLREKIKNFKIVEKRMDLNEGFIDIINNLTQKSSNDRWDTDIILQKLQIIENDLDSNTSEFQEYNSTGIIENHNDEGKVFESNNVYSKILSNKKVIENRFLIQILRIFLLSLNLLIFKYGIYDVFISKEFLKISIVLVIGWSFNWNLIPLLFSSIILLSIAIISKLHY
ncbi:hypothetical protein WICMUC_004543 [Wickerhamomyces mucosus]|uniref:non-specific serine/threonine protein kinase n=1 Tax=Wickerhamomyces mucosus TaxID=1378264 RepID=A0A9P8PHU2_9ASCO|nr:hypothetical protein WICMUC_004543 [Wickerhamomyces mucosus]